MTCWSPPAISTGGSADVAGTTWAITGQMPTTELVAGQGFVAGTKVSFQTAKGNAGSVFIPQAAYNTDNVRARVAQLAAQLDEISGLTG